MPRSVYQPVSIIALNPESHNILLSLYCTVQRNTSFLFLWFCSRFLKLLPMFSPLHEIIWVVNHFSYFYVSLHREGTWVRVGKIKPKWNAVSFGYFRGILFAFSCLITGTLNQLCCKRFVVLGALCAICRPTFGIAVYWKTLKGNCKICIIQMWAANTNEQRWTCLAICLHSEPLTHLLVKGLQMTKFKGLFNNKWVGGLRMQANWKRSSTPFIRM